MRIQITFILGFIIVLLGAKSGASDNAPLQIQLQEDEVILPALVRAIRGGRLNFTSFKGTSREIAENEWLEIEDFVRTRGGVALQVQPSEQIQWVAGGVLDLKVGKPVHLKNEIPYSVELKSGWLRFFSKKGEFGSFQIMTPEVQLSMKGAQGWVGVQRGEVELYLIEGSVLSSAGDELTGKIHVKWDRKLNRLSSKGWDAEALKVRMSALYPELIRQVEQAEEDFDRSRFSAVYREAREKGWRKRLRTSLKAP